jgi:hypothetical protein
MCPPSSSTHFIALVLMSLMARLAILIHRSAANSLVIHSCSSSTLAGSVLYTWPLMYPHKKKSNGVRSGDRGGHLCSCPSDTIRFPKSSFSRAVTTRCAGAPSCTHHPLARRPLFLSSNLSLMLGTTKLSIIAR